MYCFKCGKEIAETSIFCQYCGTQIVKTKSSTKKIIAFIALACIVCLASYFGLEEYKIYKERNPILNSENDITNDLINKIIANDLDSLTINYKFTTCNDYSDLSDVKWIDTQLKTNPFRIANTKQKLKRIEFEIKLTSKIKSLACAFSGHWKENAWNHFDELEYINIKDTSNITNMKRMFLGAESFNQPIGNWDTSNVEDMSLMFYQAESFNQPISNWDTSKVADMGWMFEGASSYSYTEPHVAK